MAYLSSDGYDYDIFVSYAHVDDRPMPGAAQGWVTTFANCIKTKLAQKLGRNDAYALWMDYELRGGQPITPHILDKLQRSATLFVVLSPGYLKSVWCQRELDTFAGMVANGQARSVFVVELEPHDEAELPGPLADLKRSPFWTKDKKTGNPHRLGELVQDADEFYSAIDDFVREVVTDLKQPKRAAAAATPAIATATAGNGAVFLAEVTDDLDEQRNSVKRYLDQAGIAVLPKDGFPLEPNAFRRAVSEGLAGADLFVQLLSGVAGKRPPDLPEGRAACQLQLALSLGRPVLHWRSAEIDVKAISDAGQRALLDAATVRAEGIEDFKREIRRRLDERRNQPVPPGPTDSYVFVDMDSADRPLAEQLCEIINRHGVGYEMPPEDPDPAKFREEFEERLRECDALIVIYGATTRDWVDGHLRQLRKMLTRRPGPLRGLAIILGPPDTKDSPSIMLPRMQKINCPGGLQEAEVRRFLEALDSRAS